MSATGAAAAPATTRPAAHLVGQVGLFPAVIEFDDVGGRLVRHLYDRWGGEARREPVKEGGDGVGAGAGKALKRNSRRPAGGDKGGAYVCRYFVEELAVDEQEALEKVDVVPAPVAERVCAGGIGVSLGRGAGRRQSETTKAGDKEEKRPQVFPTRVQDKGGEVLTRPLAIVVVKLEACDDLRAGTGKERRRRKSVRTALMTLQCERVRLAPRRCHNAGQGHTTTKGRTCMWSRCGCSRRIS